MFRASCTCRLRKPPSSRTQTLDPCSIPCSWGRMGFGYFRPWNLRCTLGFMGLGQLWPCLYLGGACASPNTGDDGCCSKPGYKQLRRLMNFQLLFRAPDRYMFRFPSKPLVPHFRVSQVSYTTACERHCHRRSTI